MMNNGQNPYGNYYNPYYPPMPNQMSANLVQQPMNMQRPVASGMGGRVVNNENEITPNEIPMDGSVSLFPTNDYSKIYAKAWTANGAIKTITFVPEVTADPVSNPSDISTQSKFQNDVLERLDRIEKAQKRAGNGYKPKFNHGDAPKKEGAQNE